MILVDTSVWVDHLRVGVPALEELLMQAQVLIHPYVIGEIACGSLAARVETLDLLQNLPMAPVAEVVEVLAFIDMHALHGKGIGYVDVHLLAAARLSGAVSLWTRDRSLHAAAQQLGCAHDDPGTH